MTGPDSAATEIPDLDAQAAELEELMPRILRRLFALQPEHPVAEMPIAQLRVCSTLQAGPRTMSALAEELGISVSAATQIVDRMERTDLVERLSCDEDRRLKRVRLSDYGASLMQARREARRRRAADALELLPPDKREALLSTLRSLLDVAVATAPPPPRDEAVAVREVH